MINKLKITFLGGVGEIGKNMTAFEYNNEIIVVDAGLTFPGDDLPGIDVVIPDFTYLINNKDKIKAIILTHGHEDHIGALPFVLEQIKAPVYGSRLTLALVENKMKELAENPLVEGVTVEIETEAKKDPMLPNEKTEKYLKDV